MGCCCCKDSEAENRKQNLLNAARQRQPTKDTIDDFGDHYFNGQTNTNNKSTSSSSSPNFSSLTYSSYEHLKAQNPKLYEEAEKRKKQLDKTIHIFVVSCASELGEEVLRIVYAELFRAVEQISNEFFVAAAINNNNNGNNNNQIAFSPNSNLHANISNNNTNSPFGHSSSSANSSPQLKLIENVLTYLNKIATAADKDSFVVVDQEIGRGRRTQMDAFGRPQYEGMKNIINHANSSSSLTNLSNNNNNNFSESSSNQNPNKLRGGGGTFGDDIRTTTSMPSFFPISESKRKDIKNKFENNKRKTKAEQDADDAAALAEFEKEMMTNDDNDGDGENSKNFNNNDNKNKNESKKTSRILRIWQDAVSIAQQTQFRPIYDRVELIKMWLLGDKVYSGSLSVEIVIKLLESCAQEQRLNTELVDRLVTQILRLSRKPQNPLTTMNFADLYVIYQENGFWFPELEQFWENAAAAAKKRTQVAAERLAADNIRKTQEADFEVKEKFRKSRAARKIVARGDDDIPLKFSPTIPTDEELRGSQEFAEALASLPEDVLTKNDLIQFLLFHQKTISLENTFSGYGGRKTSMARNRATSFSTGKARKQAELILESVGGYCSKEAFLKYLIDPDLNNILTDASREKGTITHDMSLPISNYFISSSSKSFLASDKMRNIADLGMFRRILNCGCRCIDLEIWENPQQQQSPQQQQQKSHPLVVFFNPNPTLGANSPTTLAIPKLPLDKVLAAINENAFASSSYPLIVHLDIRVYDKSNQELLCRELLQAFGSSLMRPAWQPGDVPPNHVDLSPDALLNKILLMGKRSLGLLSQRDADRMKSMDARALVNKLHAPAFAGQTFDLKKNQQQAKSGDAAVLIQQLGDLIFFDTIGGVVDISKTLPPNAYGYHCTQYEEQVALGFCSRYTTNCIKAGARQLLNVFPEGSRVACNNFNPQHYWNAGVQICSMFWQDPGLESRVYRKRFMSDNGNCGYLRKPFYMITSKGHEDDEEEENEISSPKSRNPIDSAFGTTTNNNYNNQNSSGDKKKTGVASDGKSSSSSTKTPSFHLTLEFLSAIQLPLVHGVYNPSTGKKVYRALSNPHIRAYVEGPLINNYENFSSSSSSNLQQQQNRERRQITQLFPPSMVLGDDEKLAGSQAMADPAVQEFLTFYQRNLSSTLDTTLRFLGARQSARGESSFASTVKNYKALNPNLTNNNNNNNNMMNSGSAFTGLSSYGGGIGGSGNVIVTGEGTHHPIFVDLVQEALETELKRIQTAKRVYSTSSASASTNMLSNFLEAKRKRDMPHGTGKKNVMELNVPVPDLSTLVIQIVAEDLGGGSNNNSSVSGGAGASSPSATASSSTFYNSPGTSSPLFAKSQNSSSFRPDSLTDDASSMTMMMSLKNVGVINRERTNTLENNKIIIAEAILPVHLLQTGVRCISLYDVSSYPYLTDMPEARLLVKCSKTNQAFLKKTDLLSENAIWTINRTFEEQMMEAAKIHREIEERKKAETAANNNHHHQDTRNDKMKSAEMALERLVGGGGASSSTQDNDLMDALQLEDTFGDLAQMIIGGADKNFMDKEDEDFWKSNINPMLEQMKSKGNTSTENDSDKKSLSTYQPPSITNEKEREGNSSTNSPTNSKNNNTTNKTTGGQFSVVPVPRRRRGDTTVDEFFSNITAEMKKDDGGDNANDDDDTKSPVAASRETSNQKNNQDSNKQNVLLLDDDEEDLSVLDDTMSDLLAQFNNATQEKTTGTAVASASEEKKKNDEKLYEQALMDFLNDGKF